MFNPLHSSILINNCLKKPLHSQSSYYENTDNFHYERKPPRATTKSTIFDVNKNEWNTKQNSGKMHYVLQCATRAKATSIAIAIVEFILVWLLSQASVT